MAKISLRAYNREIENRIDEGRIEEAIAHCKNIINQYPKHIETYRLLGKAYLESQRYTEAADILQRVLSVYPDDFVAHLGMSIIREDEGNLDAAIWHMERAYEDQPFNRAVQDELRRLHGRRDGVEPARIRLTRGALVRMYARGDLFPQAIAEIRAALEEDPNRIDLHVMQARMHALAGQRLEAAELSTSLLEKLPYCYEANRILTQIIPDTNHPEDARLFQQRIAALDPYTAHLSPNTPTGDKVAEQMVMVEKLDWQPGEVEAESPDWAVNLGLAWSERTDEALPDWLNDLAPDRTIAAPGESDEEEPPALAAEDALIPDFMRSAGWASSDGTVEEGPLDFGLETEPSDAESTTSDDAPIVQAEIPDWLKELAPQGYNEDTEAENEEDEQAALAWIDGILPGGSISAQSAPDSTEESPTGQDWQPEQTVPAVQTEDEQAASLWLTDETEPPAPAADDTIPHVFIGGEEEEENEAPAGQVPDWLSSFTQAGEEDLERSIEDTQPNPALASIEFAPPDWMRQAEEEELPLTEVRSEDDLPDWLHALDSETPAGDVSIPPVTDELEAPFPTLETEAEVKPPEELSLDEAMSWMENLEQKPIEVQEEVAADESAEAIPVIPVQDAPGAPEETAGQEEVSIPWLEALVSQAEKEEGALPEASAEATETPLSETEEIAGEAAASPAEESAEPVVEASGVEPEATEIGEGEETSEAIEAEEPVEATEVEGTPLALEVEGTAKPLQVGEAEQVVAAVEAVESAETVEAEELTEATVAAEETTGPAASIGETAAPDLNDVDAALSWMTGLAAGVGAADAEETAAELTTEESQEFTGASEEPLPTQATAEVDLPAAEEPFGEVELPAGEIVQDVQAAPDLTNTDDTFSWMESLAAEAFSEAAASAQPSEAPAPAEDLFDIPPLRSQPIPDPNDLDSAMSWMQNLASEPARWEEAPSEPEPAAAQPTDQAVVPQGGGEPTGQRGAGDDEIPDWLRSYQTDMLHEHNVPRRPIEVAPLEDADLDAMPAWLVAEAPEPEPPLPVPPAIESALNGDVSAEDDTEMPAWLRQLEQEQASQPAVTPTGSLIESPDAPPPPVVYPESAVDPTTPLPQLDHLSSSEALALARTLLDQGDIDVGVNHFTVLIQRGENLGEIIDDLKQALDQHPVDIGLWQALGDAYMKRDHIQDALDAYTKAEELLH